MRGHIIEITNQLPLFSSFNKARENYNGTYWMQVYKPMSENTAVAVKGAKQLCPWSMAAELADNGTMIRRKQQLLDAFKGGQNIMRQFNLPPNRIMFMEDTTTGKVTVWVD
jgi:hypothetical protein